MPLPAMRHTAARLRCTQSTRAAADAAERAKGGRMILSAFPFNCELDLLEYRLRTMAPMVDLFVLLESPVTFSGKPKPLFYEANKARFAGFPIHHVIAEERPGDRIWHREAHQRRTLE